MRFPVNFVKFLRTPFLIEHLRWLLLFIDGAIPLHNFEFKKKKCSINKRFFLMKFSELSVLSWKGELCKKWKLKGNSIKLSTFLKYGLTEVEKAPS